jgi:transketolase
MGDGELDECQVWEAAMAASANGHDVASLLGAMDASLSVSGRPTVIVADTMKGKGVAFAEGTVAFRNGAMTREQLDAALAALDGELAARTGTR